LHSQRLAGGHEKMIRKFWDKFLDPLEYLRLKAAVIMLGFIIVMIVERSFLK